MDPFDQPGRLPTSVDLAAEPFDPKGQRAAASPEMIDKVRINDDLANEAVTVWKKRTKSHDPEFADILDAVEVDAEERRQGLAFEDWVYFDVRGEGVVKILKPTPRDELKSTAWQWDPKASRYRYKPSADRKLGKLVPDDRVRRVSRRATKAEAKEMQRLAERFTARELSLVEFQTAMAHRSAMTHLQMRMLAIGGRDQMSSTQYQAVRSLWARDVQYLDRFGQQIARGEVSAARIVERSAMYADSASMTNAYEEGRLFADVLAGMDWEEWHLGATDHCRGCLEQEAKGRVPVGDLPELGTQDCNGACGCSKTRGRS